MNTLRTLYDLPFDNASRSESAERQSRESCLTAPAGLDRPDSAAARQAMEEPRYERMFLADWVDAVFIHYEVEPDALAEEVPFPLDTYGGRAFVSLVAFTMKEMRPFRGGRFGRWITRPIATHQFLNLRTYVKPQNQCGIYFMKEWLNNPLAVALGPKTFGLPYQQATIGYEHAGHDVCGTVVDSNGVFQYGGLKGPQPRQAEAGSLDEFLVERYTAFTTAAGEPRFFRVWHQPWQLAPVWNLQIFSDTLFGAKGGKWAQTAKVISGHFTKGVQGVRMGRPHRV